MRYVTYIVASATLAGAVAGCADPYAPRSGYSQGNYPSSYSYPANYNSYPSGSAYYPNRYGYGSNSDYYRNSGTRSGPQVTFTLPQ